VGGGNLPSLPLEISLSSSSIHGTLNCSQQKLADPKPVLGGGFEAFLQKNYLHAYHKIPMKISPDHDEGFLAI